MTTSKTVKAPAIKTWSKPELVKLGKIADISGAPSGATQGPNHS